MKIEQNGTLMRIILAESRRKDHAAMFRLIVDALSKAGLAGATVFKGIEGFGWHRYAQCLCFAGSVHRSERQNDTLASISRVAKLM